MFRVGAEIGVIFVDPSNNSSTDSNEQEITGIVVLDRY